MWSLRAERAALATVAVLLLALGLGRSIDRQRVWKNNETLFAATVHDAPRSYRAHFIYGRTLAGDERLNEADSCEVNSRHHPAVKHLADGFRVSATAPDGVIAAIEDPSAGCCLNSAS